MTSIAHQPSQGGKFSTNSGPNHGYAVPYSPMPTGETQEMLPDYDDLDHDNAPSSLSAGFQATRQLQVQTKGDFGNGTCYFSRDPIFIYEVAPDGQQAGGYASLRPKRGSNSCYLVRADDSSQTALCNTTYRVGPFRPPRINIPGFADEITVQSGKWGCLSRETMMETPMGVFRWRYASRQERHSVNANSLIVMDVKHSGEGSVDGWRCVGQLIRNKEFRSEGSSRWAAGNGGRLLVDLRPWVDAKAAAQQVEVLCVASCLVMLKKEVDNAQTVVVVSA